MAAEIDLAQRLLCADGACIGVIGPDGHCNVCAEPLSPRDVAEFERTTGVALSSEFARVDPAEQTDDHPADCPAVPQAEAWTAAPDEAPDLDSRVLCPDGNCVGVIGPDNSCKVCGTTNTPDVETVE